MGIMNKFIYGRAIAKDLTEKGKKRVKALAGKGQIKLAVILVGRDKASCLYVAKKEEKANDMGIAFQKIILPSNVKQKKVLELIDELNDDDSVTGMIVQLPLPRSLDARAIIGRIKPTKDADGLHPGHLAMLKKGKNPPVLPATTVAILEMLKKIGIGRRELSRKKVAIIGKGMVVGWPTYYCLKNRAKETAIYDSKTKNLAAKSSRADILIVAIGRFKFISAEYIGQGAVVIDVGINKTKEGVAGDVDAEKVENKVKKITPVPGGVGPVTVACLFNNVILLKKKYG